MKKPLLDDRLRSVAEQVRQDAVFADVGTDHAYLPIFLLCEGKIKHAVCTDIAGGPLQKAKDNARAYGVAQRCDFLLTDGLTGVENYPVTDVAICGMGGEMIADILSKSSPKIRENANFILQPMSKQDVLREELGALGFAVDEEIYASDNHKYYVTIRAHFDNVVRNLTKAEAYFGSSHPNPNENAAYRGYLSGKRRALMTALAGKKDGKLDTSEEEMLLKELFKILNDGE